MSSRATVVLANSDFSGDKNFALDRRQVVSRIRLGVIRDDPRMLRHNAPCVQKHSEQNAPQCDSRCDMTHAGSEAAHRVAGSMIGNRHSQQAAGCSPGSFAKAT